MNNAGTDTFTTGVCPSLVPECDRNQPKDDENGVGWVSLKGNPNVLGVAWRDISVIAAPEVDIVLNLKFEWTQFANKEEIAHATMVHAEGHFGGAGHSQTSGAVMFRSIATNNPLLLLQDDDKEAMRYLYPENRMTVRGYVELEDGEPATNATVLLDGTGTEFTTTTDLSGMYTLLVVPNNVTYDVVATTADGDSGSSRVLVDGTTSFDVDTIVVSSGEDGGPGFCPPGRARRDLC